MRKVIMFLRKWWWRKMWNAVDEFGEDMGYHVHIVKDIAFKRRFITEFGCYNYVLPDGHMGQTHDFDELERFKFMYVTSLQMAMITNDQDYIQKITWLYV